MERGEPLDNPYPVIAGKCSLLIINNMVLRVMNSSIYHN